MEINVNKTEAILFSPKQSRTVLEENRILGNIIVEVVNSVKTLSVQFHKNLFWDQHIIHVIEFIAKSVGILARFRFFYRRKLS